MKKVRGTVFGIVGGALGLAARCAAHRRQPRQGHHPERPPRAHPGPVVHRRRRLGRARGRHRAPPSHHQGARLAGRRRHRRHRHRVVELLGDPQRPRAAAVADRRHTDDRRRDPGPAQRRAARRRHRRPRRPRRRAARSHAGRRGAAAGRRGAGASRRRPRPPSSRPPASAASVARRCRAPSSTFCPSCGAERDQRTELTKGRLVEWAPSEYRLHTAARSPADSAQRPRRTDHPRQRPRLLAAAQGLGHLRRRVHGAEVPHGLPDAALHGLPDAGRLRHHRHGHRHVAVHLRLHQPGLRRGHVALLLRRRLGGAAAAGDQQHAPRLDRVPGRVPRPDGGVHAASHAAAHGQGHLLGVLRPRPAQHLLHQLDRAPVHALASGPQTLALHVVHAGGRRC